jgi:Lipopolysaccharide-assembly
MIRSATLLGLLALGLAALLPAGCAHYQLGTGTKAKFTTLFLAPVRCDVLLPQAQVLFTTQLREAFIKDGRVTLVNSAASADAVLQVALLGYDRTVVVSLPTDKGLARRFDESLRASATLSDNRTQQALFANRPLTVQRGVFTDSGQIPAEYQALPLLAEQLAGETVHAVLDTW